MAATSEVKGSGAIIAVVGAACRLPGADSPRQFFELLQSGRDACGRIPDNLYDVLRYHDVANAARNKMAATTGNFLGKVTAKFDAHFFGYSAEEAAQLDPQHRLALLCSYEALELAGWTPNPQEDESTCVIFGATCDDYKENLVANVTPSFAMGTARQMIAQRVSQWFGFGGSALTVDTVCSSSFLAIDIACTQLKEGKHRTAVVGGVNILTQPQVSIGLDKAHFLSRTGQCKTLDKGADGYSRADAVNVFVLKRLEDAVRDKNKIYAQILASGTNHSGEAHSITHPHSPTQITLMKRVLAQANVHPRDVKVVEAHGTGTQAGDLQELTAIRDVFVSPGRSEGDSVVFTTSKANVGHSEASSGLTAALKMILMLSHSVVPPHIGVREAVNPTLTHLLADGKIVFAKDGPLSLPAGPLIGCVNNFGASGGNTCIIMRRHEEPLMARDAAQRGSVRVKRPFVVSGRSQRGFESNRAAVAAYLATLEDQSADVQDLSYTSTARRLLHEHRRVYLASTVKELGAALAEGTSPSVSEGGLQSLSAAMLLVGTAEAQSRSVRTLYDCSPYFRRLILACDTELNSRGRGGAVPKLRQANPAEKHITFALYYAVASLLIEAGMELSPGEGLDWPMHLALLVAVKESTLSAALAQLDERPTMGGTPALPPRTLTLALDDINVVEALFAIVGNACQDGAHIHWKAVHQALSPGAKLVKVPNYVWDLGEHYVDFADTSLVTPSWSDAPVRRVVAGHGGKRRSRASPPTSRRRPLFHRSGLVLESLGEGAHRLHIQGEALSPYLVTLASEVHLLLAELLTDAIHAAFAIVPRSLQITSYPDHRGLTSIDLQCRDNSAVTVLCHKGTPIAHATLAHDERPTPAQQASTALVEMQYRAMLDDTSRSRVHALLLYRTIHLCYSTEQQRLQWASVSRDGSAVLARLSAVTSNASCSDLLAAACQTFAFLRCKGQQHRQGFSFLPTVYRHSSCGASATALLLYATLGRSAVGQAHLIDPGTGRVTASLWEVALLEPSVQSIADRSPTERKRAVQAKARNFRPGAASAAPSRATSGAETRAESPSPLAIVLSAIAAEVGLDEASFEAQDACFSDLGIDSLMSLTILDRLREAFPDADVPGSLFIDYERWSDLKPFLLALLGSGADPAITDSSGAGETSSLSSVGSSCTSAPGDTLPDADFLAITVDIICQETGADRASLEGGACFSDLGIDSLMSLTLLDRLREVAPIELPGSLFIDCDTLEELTVFLAKQGNPADSVMAEQPCLPSVRLVAATKASLEPPVKAVLLAGSPKHADAQRPLFLIPDGSGSPAVFQHVKSSGRCVYGLSSPFLQPGWEDKWEGGVTGIARRYLAQIRAKQAQGPYILGGWSFGGVTAYEVTLQLIAEGEAVESLVLLDAPCPRKMPALPHTIIDWAMESQALAGLGIKKFSAAMAQHFRSAISTLDEYHPPCMSAFEGLASRTHRGRGPRSVLLVTPVGGIEADPSEVPGCNTCVEWMFSTRQGLGAHGWDDLLGPNTRVQVSEMAGNHFTMMNPPYSEEWLAALWKWLESGTATCDL